MDSADWERSAAIAAWWSVAAGWAGAIATFLVVGVTLWLTTSQARKTRGLRTSGRTTAYRRLVAQLERLMSILDEASTLYAPGNLPTAQTKRDIAGRASTEYYVLCSISDEHILGADLPDLISAGNIGSDLQSELGRCADRNMSESETRNLLDQLSAWREILTGIQRRFLSPSSPSQPVVGPIQVEEGVGPVIPPN